MDIVDLNAADIAYLAAVLQTALDNDQHVYLSMHNGIKVKRGGSMWTLPIGQVQ